MERTRDDNEERHTEELGQRAHVTLVFSDLCDYTRLSEALDPEEIDAIRSQLDELAAAVIRRHAGFVTQVYGDGRLCVFGFPQPTENDVRSSIDAALELHEAVRKASWAELPAGFELRLHIVAQVAIHPAEQLQCRTLTHRATVRPSLCPNPA